MLKGTLKRSFILFILGGAIFSLLVVILLMFSFLTKNFYIKPTLAADNQTSWAKKINSEAPVRIRIPKIKIDANIESVGLTSIGAVDVPKGRANVGWLNSWPQPGENGNAIIVGHYGIWKNGTRGVFNNLYKLRQGDKIYIDDKKGVVNIFIVREIKKYGSKDDITDVFISGDDKAHLNLITCDGAWNNILKSYPKRLVVFADKEVK
jgi:LPXTG-site transpeptidase (sortase) family protein